MNFKYTPNTLKKLEQLYDEGSYKIRFEKGNFTSGYCVLEEKRVLVINRFLTLEGKINAMVEILPSVKINPDDLSEEMKKWYQLIINKPGTGAEHNLQIPLDIP